MIGIYLIKNTLTNECYIGKSKNISNRWASHRRGMFDKKYTLYSDMRYFGLSFFDFSIIEECSEKELAEKEMYWIKKYQEDGIKLYNIVGVPQKEKNYTYRRRKNKAATNKYKR